MGEEHGRHLHLLDRERVVHETLAVALLELETAHLVLHQRHVGYRAVFDHLHFAVYGVAEQPCAALGVGFVDVVVQARDVDARFGQHGHGAVERGREEREREIARVGHHAHVEPLGHFARDGLRAEKPLDERVDHEAGARSVGVGEQQVETGCGREVVVDEHALGRGVALDGVAQDFETRYGVEVETEQDVRLVDGARRAALFVGFENHDLPDAGHPVEEVGIAVRHDAGHPVPHVAEHGAPCERRTHGIAVGIGVRENDDPLFGAFEQSPQMFRILMRNFHKRVQKMISTKIGKITRNSAVSREI